MIGPPDPTSDLLAHIEINADGIGGAYIRQWARWHDKLAFEYYFHHYSNIDQARRSFGKSRPGTEVYVNGERT